LVELIGTNAGGTGGYNGYFSHFNAWGGPAGDSTTGVGDGWLVTSVDGGTDSAETVRILDSSTHGILRITTNDADNDNTQIQLRGSSFKYVAGKRMWFGIRCATADADDAEFAFGLILETDTDMINTLPADGIFWEKAETATVMDFHVRQDGTSTEDTAVNVNSAGSSEAMADGVFHTYQFYIDETGNIHYYYDGVKQGTVAAGNANIPDDEDLTVAIQIQAGAAAVETADIDWLYCYQER
jgi:hypothetical protein